MDGGELFFMDEFLTDGLLTSTSDEGLTTVKIEDRVEPVLNRDLLASDVLTENIKQKIADALGDNVKIHVNNNNDNNNQRSDFLIDEDKRTDEILKSNLESNYEDEFPKTTAYSEPLSEKSSSIDIGGSIYTTGYDHLATYSNSQFDETIEVIRPSVSNGRKPIKQSPKGDNLQEKHQIHPKPQALPQTENKVHINSPTSATVDNHHRRPTVNTNPNKISSSPTKDQEQHHNLSKIRPNLAYYISPPPPQSPPPDEFTAPIGV